MLEGHEFDLQTLAELFPEGDPRVVKDDEDGRYHLESSALAQYAEDHNRMAETARELLAELLGPARFHRADLGEVKVIGRRRRLCSAMERRCARRRLPAS
jgi:hypothetical protein